MPSSPQEQNQLDLDEVEKAKLSDLSLAGWLLLLLTIGLMIAAAFALCAWVLPLLPESWAMGGKDLWAIPILLFGIMFFLICSRILEEDLGIRVLTRRRAAKDSLPFLDEESWIDRAPFALLMFAFPIPGAAFFTVVFFRAAIIVEDLGILGRLGVVAGGLGCLVLTLFLLLVGCRAVVGPRASDWLDVAVNRLKWATAAVMILACIGAVWQIVRASNP